MQILYINHFNFSKNDPYSVIPIIANILLKIHVNYRTDLIYSAESRLTMQFELTLLSDAC